MISLTPGRDNQRVFIALEHPVKLTDFGIRKAWFSVGKDLMESARGAVMEKPRHGRTYIIRTKGGRKRRHVASRPGESHANLSGKLRDSMQWKVHGVQLRFGYGIANSKAPFYGPFLEEGTERMDPRPTLRNAINENRRNAEQHLLREVMKEFNQ